MIIWYDTGLITDEYVASSDYFSLHLFKSCDRVKNFISSLGQTKSFLLPAIVKGFNSSEGIDLTDSEPGESTEDEVEKILPNMDHDVLVLEDSVFHSLPGKNKNNYGKQLFENILKEKM